MKKLPEMNLSLHSLFDIVNGRIGTQLLLTAIEVKVFDSLSTPESSDAVALQAGTDPNFTRILLDGLTAMHLLEKKKDTYCSLPDINDALHSNSPAYVGEMFINMNQTATEVMENLTKMLRSGPQDVPANLGDESIWEEYARSMANYQRCGAAQQMAATVSQINGFENFQKMLDLGGGPGLYCIAMVGEHPTMHGVIFEQPAVVKVAREFIDEYEMADRVTTMAGDYINDSIGEGYDLIWASATLNFVRSGLTDMIKKIHHALNPGGVFVSLADGATHGRTRPENYILGSMPWMFMGQDIMLDSGEVAGAMRSVGFADVESTVVETAMMPMELDIARK
ncbi:methyltransferase [Desulfocicer niacini]